MIHQAPNHIRDNHKASLYSYAKIVETWMAMDYAPLSKVAEMLDVSQTVCAKAIRRYFDKGVSKNTTLTSKV